MNHFNVAFTKNNCMKIRWGEERKAFCAILSVGGEKFSSSVSQLCYSFQSRTKAFGDITYMQGKGNILLLPVVHYKACDILKLFLKHYNPISILKLYNPIDDTWKKPF